MKKRIKFPQGTLIVVGMFLILLVLIQRLLLLPQVLKYDQKVSEETPIKAPEATSIASPVLTPSPTPHPALKAIPTPSLKPAATPKIVTAPTLDDLFAKYGAQYGVSVGLLKKIAGCESGFDPNQITGDYAGLFQFGSTPWVEARGRMGLSSDQKLRFNAEESIKTASFEISHFGTSGWSDCDK